MARFLLLAKSTGRTGRVEGDPVGVFPNNHVFGEREDKSVWIANGNDPADWPGSFLVVTVLGLPWRSARRMMLPHRRRANIFELEFTAPDEVDRFITLGRHRWRLDLSKLPMPKRRQLRRDGVVTIVYNKAALNGYIVDRAGLDTLVHDNAADEIDP